TEAGSMPTYQSFGPDDRDGPEDRWKPRYSVTKNKRSPFVSWTRPLTLLCSTSIDVGVPRSLLQVGSSTSGKGRAARSSPLQKLSPLSKDIWSKRGVDRRGAVVRFVKCLRRLRESRSARGRNDRLNPDTLVRRPFSRQSVKPIHRCVAGVMKRDNLPVGRIEHGAAGTAGLGRRAILESKNNRVRRVTIRWALVVKQVVVLQGVR